MMQLAHTSPSAQRLFERTTGAVVTWQIDRRWRWVRVVSGVLFASACW